jgi:low temperature requirement protein LtrA
VASHFELVFFLARRVGRPAAPVAVPVALCLIAAVCAAIAAGLRSTSPGMATARVALLYIGLGTEGLGSLLVILLRHKRPFKSDQLRISNTELSERMAAFTLIILGEGFLSMLRTFAIALNSFNANTSNIYSQVISAIAVLFFLFLFSFGAGFSTKHWLGPRRLALWVVGECVVFRRPVIEARVGHLPLHLAILLLIAAMVNSIKATAFR